MKPGLLESLTGLISSAVGMLSVVSINKLITERTGMEVECPCCNSHFKLINDTDTNGKCSNCGAT